MKPCNCTTDPLQQSLRTRAAKLDRGNSIINRLLNANTDKIGKIVKNSPQAKYSSEPPALSILEQSEFSGDLDSEKVSIRTRAPPMELRTTSLGKQKQEKEILNENSLLAGRARQFVGRLKKQKEYEWGKAMALRRKEEYVKLRRLREEEGKRRRQGASSKADKHNKLMQSIMYHQERISVRVRNSINQYRRSAFRARTEGAEDRVTRSVTCDRQGDVLPLIISLRNRVARLSKMVDSLQL